MKGRLHTVYQWEQLKILLLVSSHLQTVKQLFTTKTQRLNVSVRLGIAFLLLQEMSFKYHWLTI